MNFSFDHLVHFVDDPNKAILAFREKGFHAVEGGFHHNKGTFNTLTYFDSLSYIEFLGAFDKQVVETMKHAKHSMRETVVRNNFKEGFTRFAIRTNDIETAAKSLREKGLEVAGPERMIRKRPDGSEVKWYLVFAGEANGDGPQLPFIIQWDDSDEARREDLIKNTTISTHPNGVEEIKSIAIAVHNLEKTANKWADLFQLPIGDRYDNSKWNAECQELHLDGGNIVFTSPKGNGLVSEVLEKSGEIIFQLNFSGGNRQKKFEAYGGTYQINESIKHTKGENIK
jgi:hypothetical protein